MLFYFKPTAAGIDWETQAAIEWLDKNIGKKCWADLGRETGVRSNEQNNALHLGLSMIAKSLNDAGLDMKKVLKPEVDIPWTTDSVKEYLWRPVQKVMTGKKSTTELNKTNEIDEVWEVLMRHLGEKHELEFIPFPSKMNQNV